MQTRQKPSSSRTTCSVDWRVARDGDFYLLHPRSDNKPISKQMQETTLVRCKWRVTNKTSDDVPTSSGGLARRLPSYFHPSFLVLLFYSTSSYSSSIYSAKMPTPVSKTFAALRNAPANLLLSPSVKSLKLSFVAKNAGPGPRYVASLLLPPLH